MVRKVDVSGPSAPEFKDYALQNRAARDDEAAHLRRQVSPEHEEETKMTERDATATDELEPVATEAEGTTDSTAATDTAATDTATDGAKTVEADALEADGLEDFDLEDVEIIESKVFA
jgi:hypothetical protein